MMQWYSWLAWLTFRTGWASPISFSFSNIGSASLTSPYGQPPSAENMVATDDWRKVQWRIRKGILDRLTCMKQVSFPLSSRRWPRAFIRADMIRESTALAVWIMTSTRTPWVAWSGSLICQRTLIWNHGFFHSHFVAKFDLDHFDA